MVPTKNIENILDRLLQEMIEQSIKNVGTGHYLTSKEVTLSLFETLKQHSQDILTLDVHELIGHFEPIGYRFYKTYNVVFVTWMNLVEKFNGDLLYAIRHGIVEYDEDLMSLRISKVINGLCKGYLHASAEETLDFVYERIDAINVEMDVTPHEQWYQSFLQAVIQDFKDVPVVNFETSLSYKWTQSLDFKLLMKACTFDKESTILLLMAKIYDIAREFMQFERDQNYKDAYNFFIVLDQKVNLLSDLLKEVLFNFYLDKMRYFFTLFSQTILFEKRYSYFLTLVIKTSSLSVHERDAHRLLFRIFKKVKREAIDKSYDLTGITNDGESVHLLMHYSKQSDVDEVLALIDQTIEKMKSNEMVLMYPEFLVRAAQTEHFSGMDAEALQTLSMEIGHLNIHIPSYELKEKDCLSMRKDIEIDKKVTTDIIEKLHNNEIELYFQPIVRVNSDENTKLAYCEVLSRIENDGVVREAEEFIHVIHKEKLDALLDRLIYEKLALKAEAISKVVSKLSVNIFPDSFQNKETLQKLEACLESFHKHNIIMLLEITEYNLFENYQLLEAMYQKYPNTLRIAVDDFGSGYSSLGALIKLSKKGLLDTIKIDGSLTRYILKDEISEKVVATARELAYTLNANTVIEFIENKDVEAKLKELSYPFFGQGYFYSKAIKFEEIEKKYKMVK